MSLSSALLAVLVQQWAYSYIRATQERQSPQERVKTRTFCAKGLEKSRISLIVRTVPTLIHVSLFLFFAGLPIWLFNINPLVCWPVVSWLALGVIGYAYITIKPILYRDSPYYSPLSSLIRRCKIFMQFLFSLLFEIFPNLSSSPFGPWLPGPRVHSSVRRAQLSISLHGARLQAAKALSQDLIYDTFKWTFESLKRDSEFEQFYDAIPDLSASLSGDPFLEKFITPNRGKLSRGLVGLMDRTFSSNLVAESVKLQRIKICMRVAGSTKQLLLGHWYFLRRVLLGEWSGFLASVPFGRFVQNWPHVTDATTILCIRFVVSAIVATEPARDETWPQLVRSHQPWVQLVRHHLDVSESTLQEYIVDRHKLSLANLNRIVSHITRFTPQSVSSQAHAFVLETLKVLESICKFDVGDALPALQDEFCDLWNQLVRNANDPQTSDIISTTALMHICKIHDTLHGVTGALTLPGADTAQYPVCTKDGPHSTQSASTSDANNASSRPVGNADTSTASLSQYNQLTAGPASSTSTSTSSHALHVARPTSTTSASPALSTSNTVVPTPMSAPTDGGTRAIP